MLTLRQLSVGAGNANLSDSMANGFPHLEAFSAANGEQWVAADAHVSQRRQLCQSLERVPGRDAVASA